MTTRHFILATAGHVDHGKSSLVKQLTGTDPDRLPEEKARGITIDLGFAHLQLEAQAPEPVRFEIGIVDVPGHEDFVTNMVAGVGAVDVALLVVAADDGWMPQTEEHLQILSYLGVKRAVVALSKVDLAPGREAEIVNSVRQHLQGTPLAGAPIVPTSVLSGAPGLTELKAALTRVFAGSPLPRDIGKPRLPVDRAFTLRGIGTVITGTLSGGRFERGQPVIIQPAGQTTRIRTIQSHNQELASVGPGTRTALALADVSLANKRTPPDADPGIRRGQVVTLAAFGPASSTLEVLLERSPRSPRVLKDATRVRLHLGSGHATARLLLSQGKELLPGDRSLAQLRCESPVFAFAGDRFILRDWAEEATLAGGIVLDPEPNRLRFRSAEQQQFLRDRAEAADDPRRALRSLLERERLMPAAALLVRSNFGEPEVAGAAAQMRAAGQSVAAGNFLAEAAYWNSLRETAIKAVDSHHRDHPEQIALPLSQLRSLLEKQLHLPGAFDALVADLSQSGLVQAGAGIKRRTHSPALPPQLQLAGTRIRSVLAAKPLDPPSRKELASTAPAQQALRFLIQTGEVVELGEDLVLLASAYRQATDAIRKHLRERTAATVSELRQAVGASRRIVVPLLERLDREGVTRRSGDVRSLKQP